MSGSILRHAACCLVAVLAVGGEAAVAPRANLLDDPGFDVGGSVWRFCPWGPGTDLHVPLPVLDADVVHAGWRSLRLPGRGYSLESRLYPYVPGRAYTLSAWMRGAGPAAEGVGARMFLLTPTWRIQQLEIPARELGPAWRRYSLTFRPPPAAAGWERSIYVRIDPHADLWVDSLQLEEGEAATPFAAGAQVGVTVEHPDMVAAPGEVRLTVRVAQDTAAPARLRVRAEDVRGAVLWSAERDAGPVGPQGCTLALPAAIGRLGVAAVRAELAAAGGATLAASQARVLVADPAAPRVANRLIGIDNSPLQHGLAQAGQLERWSDLLGTGCSRLFFLTLHGMRHRLDEDGPEYLALAAELLAPELNRRRPLTVCLEPDEDSPLNLHAMRKDKAPIADPAVERAEIARYAERAGRIAAAMRGSVSCIELLNEPNIWIVDGVRTMPADRLARVVAAAAPAIRAAAPGMQVAANINGIDPAYVDAFLAAGGAGAIDRLTVHPYRAGAEQPPLYEDLRRLRAVVDRRRPGLPIESTEQYFLSVEDGFACEELGRNYAAEREADQAARSIQCALHALAAGASAYVFFAPERSLVRPMPGGAHWFFAAGMLRQLARATDGVVAGRDVAVHPACRAFLLRRGDGSLLAVAMARTAADRGSIAVPAGCTAADADGNRVDGPEAAIDQLPLYLGFPAGTGEAAAIAALQGAGWTGFDAPLAVVPRAEGGRLIAEVANRGRHPAGGTVEVVDAPAGWPRAAVALPALVPGESRFLDLGAVPTPLAWDAPAALRWRVASGGRTALCGGRVPTIVAPWRRGGWPAGAWIELGEAHRSTDFGGPARPHRGAADLAAQVALAWDADGLHLAAEVVDDRVLRGDHDDGDLWRSDSLQLYLDPADAAQPGGRGLGRMDAVWTFGPGRDGRTTVAWLDHNPGDRYVGAANAETGPDPDVAAEWARTDAGWRLRVRIPPAALPGLRLAAGARLGWSVLINDNDGDGRKQGLTLGAPGSEPCTDSWSWRCVELGAGP